MGQSGSRPRSQRKASGRNGHFQSYANEQFATGKSGSYAKINYEEQQHGLDKNSSQKTKTDVAENPISSATQKYSTKQQNNSTATKKKPQRKAPKAPNTQKESFVELSTDFINNLKNIEQKLVDSKNNIKPVETDEDKRQLQTFLQSVETLMMNIDEFQKKLRGVQEEILKFSKQKADQEQNKNILPAVSTAGRKPSKEIFNVQQYFSDDLDWKILMTMNDSEKIDIITKHATTLNAKVEEFKEEKDSLEYHVLAEKLMRLIENLDKIKSSEHSSLRKRKVALIQYINNLHNYLEEHAKDNE